MPSMTIKSLKMAHLHTYILDIYKKPTTVYYSLTTLQNHVATNQIEVKGLKPLANTHHLDTTSDTIMPLQFLSVYKPLIIVSVGYTYYACLNTCKTFIYVDKAIP